MNIWEWNQGYCESWLDKRTLPANFCDTLKLAFFPPGYKVSDGVTPGGVYPTTQESTNYPIILWPEPAGTGSYRFRTEVSMTVENTSSATAFYYAALGVAYPSGPAPTQQPMWPYLGVAHVADDPLQKQGPLWTLQPRESKLVVLTRMDVVSNLFTGPGGVPPSPWSVELCQTQGIGYLMYPGVCVSFYTTTGVTVGAINAIGMMDANS